MLVREDLVDYAEDNPEWEVFPNTPPVDYSSTDTRVRWCFAAGPGCDEVVGTSASPLAWDVGPSNRQVVRDDLGNNSSRSTTGSATTPSRWARSWRRRARTASTPTRGPTSGSRRSARRPSSRRPAAQRHRRGPGEPVRDAQPDARLVVPPRLHRGDLQPAGRQLRPGRQAERPRAGQRPGRRGERRSAGVRGARQRQPDHPAGRHRADHQHVPLAADRGRRSTPRASTATSTCR